MRVAIFGLGYVGCAAAGCIAAQGHKVIGIDPVESKVDAINAGRSPIREPGLDALIGAAARGGLLAARREPGDALADCDIAIVCVGTPSGVDGAHNMAFIAAVTRQIGEALAAGGDRAEPLTIAFRSTMRPGSIEQIVLPILRAQLGTRLEGLARVAYNPEFLREGCAIDDYFHPPRIVVGTSDGTPDPALERLHEGIIAETFTTRWREAELTKFVDNSWHAVKVAFANEIGRICEQLEISAATAHAIFTADTKLNISPAYLRPGNAFGGSCLPKDVRALQHIAADVGANTHLIDALLRSNEAHKHHQFQRATQGLEPGARVLLAGLAFKPGTDDLRESPAVDMARKLLDAGYALDIYDPALKPEQLVGQNLGYAFAYLPTIESLLVDKPTAEARAYARVIATSRMVDSLDLPGVPVVDISVIA